MRITIDMFSGRPNPTWLLVGDELESFRAELTRAIHATEARTGPVRLGFRGVILEATGEEEDLGFGFRGRKVVLVDRRGPIDELEVALVNRLLETAGGALPGGMAERISERMQRFRRGNDRKSARTAAEPTAEPDLPDACERVLLAHNPDWWNNPISVDDNNCYNYATNCGNDTFAQPGRQSGQEYTQFTCDNVGPAAVRDGLRDNCNEQQYSVALVMTPAGDPDPDYHWYRQQLGNFWGHKPGQTDVTDLDDSGQVIIDPQTADRGDYTIFCGYMWSGVGLVVS